MASKDGTFSLEEILTDMIDPNESLKARTCMRDISRIVHVIPISSNAQGKNKIIETKRSKVSTYVVNRNRPLKARTAERKKAIPKCEFMAYQ